jgi:hypothetical protein
MNLPKKFSLEKMLASNHFVQSTLAQTEKNLAQFIQVTPFSPPKERLLTATLSWLENQLQTVLNSGSSNFTAYLYLVDLKESNVNEILHNWQSNSLSKLAQYILEREAQKVFIRMHLK